MNIVRELMNFDSFWTLWFWITHAVAWSMASHFAMGVPYDMIQEANRENDDSGPWAKATESMIQAQVFRFTRAFQRYGTALVGASAFLLAVIATLGIFGKLEFARALFTILGPLTLIYAATIATALHLDQTRPTGRELRNVVRRQRLTNQLIGLLGVGMAVSLAVWEFARDIQSWLW